MAVSIEQESRQNLRAKVSWPVAIQTEEGTIERVTYNISPDGAFIRGLSPLGNHEVVDMIVSSPYGPISVKAKVVWLSSQVPPEEDMPRGMGVEFIKISKQDREMITSLVTEYLESTSSDEDKEDEDSLIEEKLMKAELAGDGKDDMNTLAVDPPKQCPCGHKHISWSADEDRIFCWDCNSWYPLAECLGRKDAEFSKDVGLKG
jgi:hypothetical protein